MSALEWLFEPEDPSVRYRAIKELSGSGDAADALEAKRAIPGSKPARVLLEDMHPDGYWLEKNSRTGRVLGEGVEYGAFDTTHFCLAYLAEMGLDRGHPLVAKAAGRYLGLMSEDGDWYRHFSCLYAYNLRTYLLLGYRGDKRLDRTVNLLLLSGRKDGGYLCDMHEKPGKRLEKSCIRGSVKALTAFAELPEYWQHELVCPQSLYQPVS